MKKIILTLIVCVSVLITNAQDASVEKSTFGIQTGFLGAWIYNELKLSNQIALRSEIGLDSDSFIVAPVITLEPRWYYNLSKRRSKSKNISGNSGNFLSLKTRYHPDWFVLPDEDNSNVINQLSIIPTWGIRRSIGNHFIYEVGIGIGYRFFSSDVGDFEYLADGDELAGNLHLRIGYRF